MCGIAGLVNYHSTPDKQVLQKMQSVLHHRGPDDQGIWSDQSAGLVHTRLSILDLSSAGHQPMLSADEQVVLVYNGELYNSPELRKQLQAMGCSFKGSSDTEVILQSYLCRGIEAFSSFSGMFAFAIWDAAKKTLYLVRDGFGIKPLYYFQSGGETVFGSEINALLASPVVKKEINSQSLHEYLWYGNALENKTFFDGVMKVTPGCYLEISANRAEEKVFWRPAHCEPITADYASAVDKTQTLLDEAVERHLLSDVPVGVFLSGGIDSSAITAFASKHFPAKTLKTYSVGFDFDKGVNELAKAASVAKTFSTDHHELHIKGGDLPQVIESLVEAHGEPFADAANIPLYLLCEQLKGDIKVVLQGDGGDEIFAGYRRYELLSQLGKWRSLAMVWKLGGWGLSFDKKRYSRLNRLFMAIGQGSPAMRMALLLTQESTQFQPDSILSPTWQDNVKQTNPFQAYFNAAKRFESLDPVQQMLSTDCELLLPNTFLEKVDRSTMANSIEVRVPFLDKTLTEYVMGLPAKYKVANGQKKKLLRAALRGIVPDAILDAPKTGFGVPYGHWLRTSLADYAYETLFSDKLRQANLFDEVALKQCFEQHKHGRRNYGFLLWKALQLALWYKAYL